MEFLFGLAFSMVIMAVMRFGNCDDSSIPKLSFSGEHIRQIETMLTGGDSPENHKQAVRIVFNHIENNHIQSYTYPDVWDNIEPVYVRLIQKGANENWLPHFQLVSEMTERFKEALDAHEFQKKREVELRIELMETSESHPKVLQKKIENTMESISEQSRKINYLFRLLVVTKYTLYDIRKDTNPLVKFPEYAARVVTATFYLIPMELFDKYEEMQPRRDPGRMDVPISFMETGITSSASKYLFSGFKSVVVEIDALKGENRPTGMFHMFRVLLRLISTILRILSGRTIAIHEPTIEGAKLTILNVAKTMRMCVLFFKKIQGTLLRHDLPYLIALFQNYDRKIQTLIDDLRENNCFRQLWKLMLSSDRLCDYDLNQLIEEHLAKNIPVWEETPPLSVFVDSFAKLSIHDTEENRKRKRSASSSERTAKRLKENPNKERVNRVHPYARTAPRKRKMDKQGSKLKNL